MCLSWLDDVEVDTKALGVERWIIKAQENSVSQF
jgi:hypothetical protein